jgi:hypothetical protein
MITLIKKAEEQEKQKIRTSIGVKKRERPIEPKYTEEGLCKWERLITLIRINTKLHKLVVFLL